MEILTHTCFEVTTLDGKTGLVPGQVSGFQGWKNPGTVAQTWHQAQMTQIYSNPLNFFVSPCPEYPCHSAYFPVFYQEFLEGKILFQEKSLSRLPGVRKMGDGRESLVPDPNFNRPVKDLVYKDLLTSTFTQVSHDRGIKTWRDSVSNPQCVFCGNKFRYKVCNVEWHMDPSIGKVTTGKERTVTECKDADGKRPCLDNGKTADEDTDPRWFCRMLEWDDYQEWSSSNSCWWSSLSEGLCPNFSHGTNSRVYGEGNCSWKEEH